jgi:ATP-dependent Zn protease
LLLIWFLCWLISQHTVFISHHIIPHSFVGFFWCFAISLLFTEEISFHGSILQLLILILHAAQPMQSRSGEGSTNMDDTQTDTRSRARNYGSQYMYYFNIGSIDSFERKLEDAQDTLGVDPRDYIPVTYVSEMSWQQELLRLAPTILLIAGYIYFSKRMQGGFGMGGGNSSMGGRGIFTVGKAQVTKISKKQKDKVCFPLAQHLMLMLLFFFTVM